MGSFFEKPEHKTKYNAIIFPKNNNDIHYRVTAEVYVYSNAKKIQIEKVYFPKGRQMDFDGCEYFPTDHNNYCSDQKGQAWYIKIYNTQVE